MFVERQLKRIQTMQRSGQSSDDHLLSPFECVISADHIDVCMYVTIVHEYIYLSIYINIIINIYIYM